MTPDWQAMLAVAIEEARQGLAEGGIPIGAALFDGQGRLLGRGHNRRVQEGDPSVHGETDAFRKAGRQRSYRDKVVVTTLAPCWYCSGLVRQFSIGTVVVGESVAPPPRVEHAPTSSPRATMTAPTCRRVLTVGPVGAASPQGGRDRARRRR